MKITVPSLAAGNVAFREVNVFVFLPRPLCYFNWH